MAVLSFAVMSSAKLASMPCTRSTVMVSRRGCLLGLLGGLLLAGCGGPAGEAPVKINGVVKYNGKPLTDGSVMFNPSDPQKGRVAQGKIQKDGTFSLSTSKEGDGVLAGSYTVTVTSTLPGTETLAKDKGTGIGGKSAIPERYGDPKASQLTQTIAKSDAGKTITLELKD